MPKLYNLSTNKNGAFIFGGESSADFGLIITEAPTLAHAQRKSTAFEVPGRNGVVLFQQDAFADVPRQYKVALAVDQAEDLPGKIDAVIAWLNSNTGYTRLEDSFEPDAFRLAYYNGGDSFTNNMMQYGEATISFTCKANIYYKSGENVLSLTNGTPVYNPTRYKAAPLIHIEGSGSVSLTLGANTITATLTDYINIDCETMNAYRQPAENMNNKIGGDFPELAPGSNAVAFSGSISKIEIIPRFYTI